MKGIGINISNLQIPDCPEIIGELISPIQFYPDNGETFDSGGNYIGIGEYDGRTLTIKEDQKELIDYLKSQGYSDIYLINGHGVCAIKMQLFTFALIVGLNMIHYKGRYCYGTYEEAQNAIDSWNGEGDPPFNWIKYKGEGGERTNPNNKI